MSEKDFDKGFKSGFKHGREYRNTEVGLIIHDVILSFFDDDDTFTEKDKLLLKVNKAIAEGIKLRDN